MSKKSSRKQKIGLHLIFAGFVFLVLLITLVITGLLIYILQKSGLYNAWAGRFTGFRMFLFIAVICQSVGMILSYLFGMIFMAPVNSAIDTMNALASGDFSVRLRFRSFLGDMKMIRGLTDSFNKMAKELENTEMLRNDFINNFSHEFKTPIVSIAGFAALLRKSDCTEEEKNEYLAIIESESKRLSEMATNVLNVSKLQNLEILTGITEYNLSEQIRECVLILEEKWEKKDLDMDLNFREYDIQGNEELLQQVWLNLLDNAVKFSDEKGTIGIVIDEKDGMLDVSVSNTGSTIPEDRIPKLFDKFYQADESHAREGNGVGLAIVKRITDLHKGSIRVSSNDGFTVFTVSLPAVQK